MDGRQEPRNDNPLEHLIKKLKTHHELAPEDHEALLGLPFKLRTLDPQSYIIREGDRLFRTYFIDSRGALGPIAPC